MNVSNDLKSLSSIKGAVDINICVVKSQKGAVIK
jgi:hypothetical protein